MYTKKETTTKECSHCKQVFTQKRCDQIFCSRACKHYHILTKKRHPYRLSKKSECELCGFIPVDLCQLDVDHIDGNHKNNEVSNLQTLCANCHRLKTKTAKDGTYSQKQRRETGGSLFIS